MFNTVPLKLEYRMRYRSYCPTGPASWNYANWNVTHLDKANSKPERRQGREPFRVFLPFYILFDKSPLPNDGIQ